TIAFQTKAWFLVNHTSSAIGLLPTEESGLTLIDFVGSAGQHKIWRAGKRPPSCSRSGSESGLAKGWELNPGQIRISNVLFAAALIQK
ncbi:MAG TPA: hypothetical protein VMW23_10525, partial [Sedimentisphaerales bacterium]|nr:hypothetical protein [Sedimentisphaerales bacterium]